MRFKRAPRHSIASVEERHMSPCAMICCGTMKITMCMYHDLCLKFESLFSSFASLHAERRQHILAAEPSANARHRDESFSSQQLAYFL
eukprot:1135794-Pleurochrysis_carterae.AAC.1